MNFKVLRFILLITLFRRFTCEVITHGKQLKFGKFFAWSICQAGRFATSFEIKADREEKNFSDEEGMTGIRLYCSEKNGTEAEDVFSHVLEAGDWKGKNSCPPGEWLDGFRIRIQESGGWAKDDTGANNVEMICNNNTIINGRGTNRGDWTDWVYCPKGEVICGLRVRAEATFTADRAGIVGIEFMCCNLTGETRMTVDPLANNTFIWEYGNETYWNGSTFNNSTFSRNASSFPTGFDNMFNRTGNNSNANRTQTEGLLRNPSDPFNSTSSTFISDTKQNDTRSFNSSSNHSGVDNSLFGNDSNPTSGSDKGISFPRN